MTRPAHPCAEPGCASLVRGNAYCGACRVTREERNPKAAELRAFYDSTRWKTIRAIVRRNQPICMECKRRPSQTVDHLNGIEDNRLESLRALCWGCHNRKSGREHSVKRHGLK